MARRLNATVMVDATIYEAGTPESEIDGEITAEGVWDGESDQKPEGYASLKVDALKAEIAKRNEGREESDFIPADGKKDDLIAALEADDEAKRDQAD